MYTANGEVLQAIALVVLGAVRDARQSMAATWKEVCVKL
jgi:hypothetical protein